MHLLHYVTLVAMHLLLVANSTYCWLQEPNKTIGSNGDLEVATPRCSYPRPEAPPDGSFVSFRRDSQLFHGLDYLADLMCVCVFFNATSTSTSMEYKMT